MQQAQSALTTGAFSSRELCAYYLDRIAALDKSGPAVNSVIELNPQALDIARAAAWLACDESDYVTGQASAVDGGEGTGITWSKQALM